MIVYSVSHSLLSALNHLTSSVVKDALLAIYPRKSAKEDNLDPIFLPHSAQFTSERITHIFSLSISSIVQRVWELVHLIHLHKGDDKSNLNNY